MLHRDTGAVLGSVALPGEPDVIMHAPELDRLYVAVGSPGTVSVVDDQTFDTLETVVTGPGAHTMSWDPDRRMLYAFRPESMDVAVFVER